MGLLLVLWASSVALAGANIIRQPSETAIASLRRFGLASVAEAVSLGLTSNDLLDMGVEAVEDRIAILSSSSETESKKDFAFTASYVNSTRQWGKCLNIVVKYRYSSSATIDYREIYSRALYYAQPTDDIAMDEQWEVVNNAFVNETMNTYSDRISSISSLIQVRSQDNEDINEPGNHGSTVTVGNLVPIVQPWVSAFSYDCTKYTGPNAPVDDWQ